MNRLGIERIHHLALAVRSLETALEHWRTILGVDPVIREFPEQRLREAVIVLGEVRIRLCQSTEPGLRFAQWVDEQGGDALHHVCVEVRDLNAATDACRDAGLEPAALAAPSPLGLGLEFIESTARPEVRQSRPAARPGRQARQPAPVSRKKAALKAASRSNAATPAKAPRRTVRARGKVRKGGKK